MTNDERVLALVLRHLKADDPPESQVYLSILTGANSERGVLDFVTKDGINADLADVARAINSLFYRGFVRRNSSGWDALSPFDCVLAQLEDPTGRDIFAAVFKGMKTLDEIATFVKRSCPETAKTDVALLSITLVNEGWLLHGPAGFEIAE